MSRIANGAKKKLKKQWKHKAPYMKLAMKRIRAAERGDAQAYYAADAALDAAFPSRGRKPLMEAKRAR